MSPAPLAGCGKLSSQSCARMNSSLYPPCCSSTSRRNTRDTPSRPPPPRHRCGTRRSPRLSSPSWRRRRRVPVVLHPRRAWIPPTFPPRPSRPQPHRRGDVVRREHAVPVHADHDGVPDALIAAFSPAGVRPVGFGTVWMRGSSPTSSAAISSVRSWDGPSAITTSSSPSYSCSRMCRTASTQMPLLVQDRHDHGDGGGNGGRSRRPRLPRTGDSLRTPSRSADRTNTRRGGTGPHVCAYGAIAARPGPPGRCPPAAEVRLAETGPPHAQPSDTGTRPPAAAGPRVRARDRLRAGPLSRPAAPVDRHGGVRGWC